MIIILKIILTILLIFLAVSFYFLERANNSKIFFDLLFQTITIKLDSLETDEQFEEFNKYAQEIYDLEPFKVIHSIKPLNPKYWLSSECINYFNFVC